MWHLKVNGTPLLRCQMSNNYKTWVKSFFNTYWIWAFVLNSSQIVSKAFCIFHWWGPASFFPKFRFKNLWLPVVEWIPIQLPIWKHSVIRIWLYLKMPYMHSQTFISSLVGSPGEFCYEGVPEVEKLHS